MPKKKTGATKPAADHPALSGDKGPERKTRDSLIIEDHETRALVSLLLGKWSDAKPLEDYYRRTLEESLDFKEAIERYRAGGQVNPTTMPEAFVEQWRRLESAAGRLEAIIGERIKARLIEALGEAVELAAKAEFRAIVRGIKGNEARRKATLTRLINASAALVKGEDYHFGRKVTTARDEVERRSVEIIRAIGAGPGDKGRVAMAYYSKYDFSKPGEQDKIERDYQAARRKGKADGLLRRYHGLLNRQKPAPLKYESLLETAASDWFGKELWEYLRPTTDPYYTKVGGAENDKADLGVVKYK